MPEELKTVPGIVQNQADVDFYSREYPLESQNLTHSADREWVWTVYSKEVLEDRRVHDRLNKPIVEAARNTGDIEPTAEPVPGKDVTQEIKDKAREMGFGEVGITRYDMRYIFQFKKDWVKFPNAICLAFEQDYEPTQSAPSLEAEGPHFGTYRIMGAVALELADYIRSLGYHAQVHSPNDNSAAYIPMFVEAGLGQLGANGQLLSPHFGSRARLMIITTEAPVDLRRARGLRHARLLLNMPGLRKPLSRQGSDEGEGLVEGCSKEQAGIWEVPPCNGPVRGLCGVHEGLSRPAVWHEERTRPLRHHRAGAG